MMKKTIAILIVAILSITMLSACGNMANSHDSNTQRAPSEYYSQGGGGGSTGSGSDYGYDSSDIRMEMGLADADYSYNYSGTSNIEIADSIDSTMPDGGVTEPTTMSEKIIYSAYASIETVEFDETVEKVYELLSANGAFIENSFIGGRNYLQSYHGYQTHRTADFTLRVPKERFNAITNNLDILGNVTSLRTDAENITAQFYDTDSRLASYRIQEERLLDMLDRADNVTDMISIESRLSDIRYYIESLTSTLRNWQSHVDYSSLSISIYEVERYTEIVPVQQRTYWQQVGDGFIARTRGVGEFFMDLFKWLVVNLPVLIILAVIIIVLTIFIRRLIRKERKRYQEKKENARRNAPHHIPPMHPPMNPPMNNYGAPPMTPPVTPPPASPTANQPPSDVNPEE